MSGREGLPVSWERSAGYPEEERLLFSCGRLCADSEGVRGTGSLEAGPGSRLRAQRRSRRGKEVWREEEREASAGPWVAFKESLALHPPFQPFPGEQHPDKRACTLAPIPCLILGRPCLSWPTLQGYCDNASVEFCPGMQETINGHRMRFTDWNTPPPLWSL